MPQFDVHRVRSGVIAVDCQADLLSHLTTRFVIPLLPDIDPPPGPKSLHPMFDIGGVSHILAPQYAASIAVGELGPVIASLAKDGHRVTGAIDVLMAGV